MCNLDRPTMTAHAPLTPGQLALLGAELAARRKSLAEALDLHQDHHTRVAHAREVLTQDGDDAPQRDAEREVDQAITEHDISEIAALDAALARLHSPDYGRCADCAEAIAFDRLRAAPQALRCVACERRHEAAQVHAQHARL
jgi:DnaK suppressor protein